MRKYETIYSLTESLGCLSLKINTYTKLFTEPWNKIIEQLGASFTHSLQS